MTIMKNKDKKAETRREIGYNAETYSTACIDLSNLDERGFLLVCEMIQHEKERLIAEQYADE
jgi:hypothetical protein